MEVLRVQTGGSLSAADRFAGLMKNEIERFLHSNIAVEMNIEQVGNLTEFIICSADHDSLIHGVAAATADYILEVHEKDLIRNLISDEYGYGDPEELHSIEAYCWHNSDPLQDPDNVVGKNSRRNQLIEEVKQYLDGQSLLNVEGLVRFRLQAYIEQLQEIVEYAIDEYTADKQYEEFVSLLKYFVYIQEAKIPAAHLIHKGIHEFTLLDEKMEPIETKQLDQFVVEMIDKEINYEDMIVSTLITVSPQNVFIHTRHPEMQVIKTIQQIFEDRATVCTSCPRCRPILGEYNRHDHYYR